MYEYLIIKCGRVEESVNRVELVIDLFFSDKILCLGIMEDFVNFGYVFKGLKVMDGAIIIIYVKFCMIWYVFLFF